MKKNTITPSLDALTDLLKLPLIDAQPREFALRNVLFFATMVTAENPTLSVP
jgi:hypothetical protein